MSPEKILFIDRDGTFIEEPLDQETDSLANLRLAPGVIPALLELKEAGYRFVLAGDRGGLGTPARPQPAFRERQDFVRELFASQGIEFDAEFAAGREIDRGRSYVIGDRQADLDLAADLGIGNIRVRSDGRETWPAIARRLCRADRVARVSRRTKETDVNVSVNLDRETPVSISTGIGFFDHMLEQVARHGGFSLELTCTGDLHVDEHHTVEDCALALGQALREALGDKRGIGRYGFVLPMDEALAQVAIDLSGRAFSAFTGRFGRDAVGALPTELVPHFFRSLADSLGAAIHVEVRGENTHHMIEACFKGVGRALRRAVRVRGTELPSSKGVL
jgi:imidazoleglycerol-phosphate dehydratase/histidinol-phosphatase